MTERSAGILLHPTSLPGDYGIGDLGPEAFNFINFLEAAGQKLWQVFPLGPTGYGDSPYQTFSAFAGNPLLISPELLHQDKLLTEEDIANPPHFEQYHIDYGRVIDYKYGLLKEAFLNFKNHISKYQIEYEIFCETHKEWLNDYALFMAVKDYHGGVAWIEWEEGIRLRRKKALKDWTEKLEDSINFRKFTQYIFFKQWHKVKSYAEAKDIKIIGDLPIFIAYDSVDLWANKGLFSVDKTGKLETVAGVPPDYFSATGQLWGNPLYKWRKMAKDDYAWWRLRIKNLLELVDIIRIDHFRGFDAYWEIPADAVTAETGRWVKGPGHHFFDTIKKYLGDLPIIAEDLGVITKSVEKLRDDFELPGIKILQFAFGTGMEEKFLPHNINVNCIVHTGSHDNDTTRGYFEKAKYDQSSDIFEVTKQYIDYFGDDPGVINEKLIKLAYQTVARMVVIPMQDVLNFGSDARMNYPGTLGGNWAWRFSWDQVGEDITERYKNYTVLYERPPKPKKEVTIETNNA